eukprot:14619226-Alexandrium_andersonii.AAC.1
MKGGHAWVWVGGWLASSASSLPRLRLQPSQVVAAVVVVTIVVVIIAVVTATAVNDAVPNLL